MADVREHDPHDPGYDVERYFDLAARGVFAEEDHVELLEGLIVASPPQAPLHAGVLARIDRVLQRSLGDRAAVRVQLPLIAGTRSVPEPDVAVVAGSVADYDLRHPDTALLVVEVSESSLAHDRLTKSRIYARACIPEYWIANLRERTVEVFRYPDPERRLYASKKIATRDDEIRLVALPDVTVRVAELVPGY